MATRETFDWMAWRRDVRRSLVEARRALPERERAQRNSAIDALLAEGFAALGGHPIAFCWPFAGEPEPRFAVRRWRALGSRACLPVVLARAAPLEFRAWRPGVAMRAGVYGIPYPVDSDRVEPEAAVIPVNGFDAAGYRLGYGGGYFDRTLAATEPRPVVIGLGYEIGRLATIHPQPHDVPLDFVVTEAGIEARTPAGLEAVSPADADERLRALLGPRVAAG